MTEPAVLVVDDDPNMQRWAAAVLKPAGYRVASATDALTGLMVVRSVKPDVVVVDLGLPGGGGKAFVERLRTLTAFQKTPILVLSGKLNSDYQREFAPLGVTEFLHKPVNPALFLRAVHRAASGGPDRIRSSPA
jgi:DNA-binding response OmpR family regulator